MCYTCNPICGRCKPARVKTVICPECSALSMFDRAEVLDKNMQHQCSKCGRDVTEMVKPVPVEYQRSGKWCAYPCGQFQKPVPGGFIKCSNNTPVELAS